MNRSYSDPSYGSKKSLSMPITGSVVGTMAAAGTELAATPVQVTGPIVASDWSLKCTVAGTHSAKSLVLCSKLAGTGALVQLGTIALGTDAINDTRTGALPCNEALTLSAGDELVVGFFGTDAIISQFVPTVTYKERYVQSDT